MSRARPGRVRATTAAPSNLPPAGDNRAVPLRSCSFFLCPWRRLGAHRAPSPLRPRPALAAPPPRADLGRACRVGRLGCSGRLGRSSLSNSFIFIALSADGQKMTVGLPKSGRRCNAHIFSDLRFSLCQTEQFWAKKPQKNSKKMVKNFVRWVIYAYFCTK